MHRFDLARIGTGLPVAGARAEIERAAAAGAAVIIAPPGTGKTTYVPPLVANLLAAGGVPGRVLVTQPRRVAVRAAARRLAALDRSAIGGAVGFTVRGERRTSVGARVEVLTPGVLLRRLLTDPGLDQVSAVILDEVHERSLDGELLLAMLAEVRELRDDLTVVAMSATLDADGVSALIGGAVVAVPSALHPLRIDYAPAPAGTARLDRRGLTRGYLAHLAETAAIAQSAAGCDALVFVPGAREVDETVRLLRARAGHGDGALEVLPLHGGLPASQQDRAVAGRAPGEPPRIVVSTSLAESSLTVPGVRLVIDSGLAREVRRDRGRDMTGLVTVSASRASAEQRAGRAARQGPGRTVRVYSEADLARMPQEATPEILSADLTDAALLLAAWGAPGGAGMRFPTPPPADAMTRAEEALRALELVDGTGRTTPFGARIAALPLGARDARALLAGTAQFGDATIAAEIIAAVSDAHREPGADLSALLRALRSGRAPGADRWRREARRLAALARTDGERPEPAGAPQASGRSRETTGSGWEVPGAILALARPEWIARRTAPHTRSYLLASGTRAALPEGSPLLASEWIAVREVQRSDGRAADGTGAVIRLAASISEGDALRLGIALVSEQRLARVEEGRVRVREERRLGRILLAAAAAAPRSEDTAPALAAHLHGTGLSALRWTDEGRSLRARLALLHREFGEPWPAVDHGALLRDLEAWLGPDLQRLRPDASLRDVDVAAALRRLLPWPEAARLDELAPERIAVPSGSRARIDYPDPGDADARPVMAVKLQELFGLAETPRIADGRVPVLFHLLSPARRPLAVTDDLASFWSGPYQEVRREMRGRYPKHPWPEDPWTAAATARTKRAR